MQKKPSTKQTIKLTADQAKIEQTKSIKRKIVSFSKLIESSIAKYAKGGYSGATLSIDPIFICDESAKHPYVDGFEEILIDLKSRGFELTISTTHNVLVEDNYYLEIKWS